MKSSKRPRTGYRLAARLRGGRLFLTAEVRDAACSGYLRRIAAIGRRRWRERCDRDAFAESVEWERLGDFLSAAGPVLRAMDAYREAMGCCLDGVPRDYEPAGTWGPFPAYRARFQLSPGFGPTGSAIHRHTPPFTPYTTKKRSDTCRCRTSLVRLVRLMRVGESHVCYTKINGIL